MNEKIIQWVKEQKELLNAEFIGYGYSDEALVQAVTREEQTLDKFVAKIINTIDLKRNEDVEELFPYFENLSNNRRIAFIFREHTKIITGSSNKDGIEAFKKCFGADVVKSILSARRKAKEILAKEEQKKEDEKKVQEDKKEAVYFSNNIWDKQKISQLTAMQKGRLKNSLDKKYNYNGTVMSVKDYLLTLTILNKEITDKMSQWSRRKVNNMSSLSEENEYEAKLKAGRLYRVNLENDYLYEIPKIIFDVLDLKLINEIPLEQN